MMIFFQCDVCIYKYVVHFHDTICVHFQGLLLCDITTNGMLKMPWMRWMELYLMGGNCEYKWRDTVAHQTHTDVDLVEVVEEEGGKVKTSNV